MDTNYPSYPENSLTDCPSCGGKMYESISNTMLNHTVYTACLDCGCTSLYEPVESLYDDYDANVYHERDLAGNGVFVAMMDQSYKDLDGLSIHYIQAKDYYDQKILIFTRKTAAENIALVEKLRNKSTWAYQLIRKAGINHQVTLHGQPLSHAEIHQLVRYEIWEEIPR